MGTDYTLRLSELERMRYRAMGADGSCQAGLPPRPRSSGGAPPVLPPVAVA